MPTVQPARRIRKYAATAKAGRPYESSAVDSRASGAAKKIASSQVSLVFQRPVDGAQDRPEFWVVGAKRLPFQNLVLPRNP